MYNSGRRGKRTNDGYGIISQADRFNQTQYPIPTVTSFTVTDGSYVPLVDTAVDPAGGQTIVINGSGFAPGATIMVGTTIIAVVTYIDQGRLAFTAPALSSGSYTIYVTNSNGGTGILVPGLVYSGIPTWTTSAGSVGTVYETTSINQTFVATGDAPVTYSVLSGSLPSGSSLSTNGVLTGTAPVDSGSTTYSFTIRSYDAQMQHSDRSFSLTITTDVVTWSSPANATIYTLIGNQTISNVTLNATSAAGYGVQYTANSLPTGVSLSGNTIYGTPTVAGTTDTLLTATANTTNRTATRYISWTVTLNDTYFKYTTLLLNGETSVTPFIADASTNSLALTIAGDTKANKFSPYYGDGYYSNYFNGSTDYLILPTSPLPLSTTSSFTLEAWVYPTSSSDATLFYILGNSTTFAGIRVGLVSSQAYILHSQNGTTWAVNSGNQGSVPLNTWTHIAVTRNVNAGTLWINGVSVYTFTFGTLYSSTTNYIGAYLNTTAGLFFPGYISNARIVNGTAVYTTAFTPSTTPLTAIANTSLLTCQSNRYKDNSTNAFALTVSGTPQISPAIPFAASSSYATYGSAYFDGTGDYLTLPASAAFGFGTGDFTVEMWIYPTSTKVTQFLFDTRDSGASTGTRYALALNNTTSMYPIVSVGSTTILTSSQVVSIGSWYHIAVSKASGTVKLFINGVQVGSVTSSIDVGASSGPAIGTTGDARGTYDGYFQGNISNLHVVKGTALYTTTFTPPTAPLTAVANTQLLTLQYNGGGNNYGFIDNGPFNYALTRANNATQGTFSPYSATGWSASRAASSSSWLTLPSSATSYRFNTNVDFTIEAWVFPTVQLANDWGIIDARAAGATAAAWLMLLTTSGGVYKLNFYNAGSNLGTITIPLNTWTHVAISRVGTNLRFFVNGTLDTTIASYGGDINPGTTSPRIGHKDYSAGAYDSPGFLSNLRIVNGTGLYTSTFTPSTSPLTPVANTQLLTCQSNTFIDNSPNNYTITVAGTPSVQAFSPFGSIREAAPISYSNYFNGSADYLSVPSTSIAFGTGDFTVEGWFYFTGTDGTRYDFFSNYSGFLLYRYSDNTLFFYTDASGTNKITVSGFTSATYGNKWIHIALTRQSGSTKLFINGTQAGSTFTSDTTNYTGTTMYIGRNGSSGIYYPGYISNFRVVTGTALYTTTFTPSTTPLTAISGTSLLTCQSTTIIDNSTNNFTVTSVGLPKVYKYNPFGYTSQSSTSYTPSIHGGSAYFDGTGDYLTNTSGAQAANFGTGNFTWESWIYFTSSNTTSEWDIFEAQPTAGAFQVYRSTANSLLYGANGSAGNNVTPVNAIPLNQWFHLAISRISGSVSCYVNGVRQTTVADTTNYNQTGISVAGRNTGVNTLPGYLSDMRIIKGSGIYSGSSFVVPATPLTQTANTSLLLNFTNGGIVDAHSTNIFETFGGVQLNTAIKKNGIASIGPLSNSSGVSNYLVAPHNPVHDMVTGDFTIEFWFYPINFSVTNGYIISKDAVTGTGYPQWAVRLNGTGNILFQIGASNGASTQQLLTSSGTVTSNTWSHVACVRSGTTLATYINGTASGTLTQTITMVASSRPLYINSQSSGAANDGVNGYIDDLRITKGFARYTANFTPPTGLVTL